MTTSPLLDLPPELRNRIYRHILVDHHFVETSGSQILVLASILHTCHQIRDEATAIFYAENTFQITLTSAESTDTLLAWLHSLGTAHLKLIVSLEIVLDIWEISADINEEMAAARATGDNTALMEMCRDRLWQPVKLLARAIVSTGIYWRRVSVMRRAGPNREIPRDQNFTQHIDVYWIPLLKQELEKESFENPHSRRAR